MKVYRLFAILIGLSLPGLAGSAGFSEQNLVSDLALPGAKLDADLKNPWGISFGPSTFFWISDNGTGVSTFYSGDGTKVGRVVVPSSTAASSSTPTGTVFNGSPNFQGDVFLFATEQGTISGWQGGASASIRVNNAGSAVYKGLAINSDRIYATNFATGHIDVFGGNYAPLTLAGAFTDPNLPAGYAPFNVQDIGGSLYVTYAVVGPTGDDVAGAGNGVVDVYNRDGTLLKRLINNGAANKLDSPWGLALAPSSFGELSGLLLVGNFGDGKINAYDPSSGAFKGTLSDAKGDPFVIDGLWALAFGNGNQGFDPNKLYFTAGLNDEANGLFGSLSVVPEPGTWIALAAGLAVLIALRRRLAGGCGPAALL